MAAIGLLYIDGFDWPILATGSSFTPAGAVITQHPFVNQIASIGCAFGPPRYHWTGYSGAHSYICEALTGLTETALCVNLTHPTIGFASTTGVPDGSSFYAGFNLMLGISSSTPLVSGYHVFCFATTTGGPSVAGTTGAGAERLFTFVATWPGGGTGAVTIQLVKGVPITVATGGTPTVLATGACNRNPWFQWSAVEFGIYRSATSGTIDLWIEGTGGTMQNVVHYAGDTSVATLGQMAYFCMSSSKPANSTATGGWVSNAFDDFWCATSGRPGAPIAVIPIRPGSDVTTQFSTSSGTTHWSLLNASPTTSDSYLIGISTVGTGSNPVTDAWGQSSWPYTPTTVYGITTLACVYHGGLTAGTHPTCYAFLRQGGSGGTIYAGATMSGMANPSGVPLVTYAAVKTLELDPSTSGAWTVSGAQAMQFGVQTTGGFSGGSTLFVHAAFLNVLASPPTTATAPATIGLQWIDGFDEWYALSPMIASTAYHVKWAQTGFQASGTGGHENEVLFSGGRQGRGRSLGLSMQAGGGSPGVYTAAFATSGVTTVSDGQHLYAGFNAYLGCTSASLTPNTGGPTGTGGYNRVFGFSIGAPGAITGGLTQHRICFYYDVGANSFVCTKGSGTPPGGTGTPLTVLASGQPTRNPWQQWTYYEMHVYRSSTSGQIDLWIENSGGTMDHLLSATALDTSVATVGALSTAFLTPGNFSSTVWFPVEYDDFWLALSGSPGMPCYVLTQGALSGSEASVSGPNAWTATSGHPNGSVVSELPWDTTDYTSFSIAQTGGAGNATQILFNQQTLPYTPQFIFAFQTMTSCVKLTTVSGNVTSTNAVAQGVIRRSSVDYTGNAVALGIIGVSSSVGLGTTGFATMAYVGVILEHDPETSTLWDHNDALNTTIGVLASGQLTATGIGSPVVANFATTAFYLASIAAVASGAAGAPASGFGQPFWTIMTGYPWFPCR